MHFQTVGWCSNAENSLRKMVTQEFASHAPLPALSKGASAIVLPTDAGDAAAYVLNYVQTADTAFNRSLAIEAMTRRIELLRETSGAQCERELMAHAAILDSLFMRFTADCVRAGTPENKAIFAKVALNCNSAYARTLIAAEGLKQQRLGKAVIR